MCGWAGRAMDSVGSFACLRGGCGGRGYYWARGGCDGDGGSGRHSSPHCATSVAALSVPTRLRQPIILTLPHGVASRSGRAGGRMALTGAAAAATTGTAGAAAAAAGGAAGGTTPLQMGVGAAGASTAATAAVSNVNKSPLRTAGTALASLSQDAMSLTASHAHPCTAPLLSAMTPRSHVRPA